MAARTVPADVAGKVWKIVAKPGDRVAADDTLVILESMKMEIPVVAPFPGTVIAILVEEGQPVREDDAIARIGA